MTEKPGARKDGLLIWGGVGTVIAALCCFTPVLVVVLAAAGVSAWLGWLDFVLLPMLAVSLGVTGYAVYRRG